MVDKKQNEETGVRKRSRGDTVTEDDQDEESDHSHHENQDDGLEVDKREGREHELDLTLQSVTVSFVSDVNKFLPAV